MHVALLFWWDLFINYICITNIGQNVHILICALHFMYVPHTHVFLWHEYHTHSPSSDNGVAHYIPLLRQFFFIDQWFCNLKSSGLRWPIVVNLIWACRLKSKLPKTLHPKLIRHIVPMWQSKQLKLAHGNLEISALFHWRRACIGRIKVGMLSARAHGNTGTQCHWGQMKLRSSLLTNYELVHTHRS